MTTQTVVPKGKEERVTHSIRRRGLLEDYRLTEREQKSLDLLELIRRRGPLTRTELSQGTGFNIVTVSNYVAEFIKADLVVERGFDVSTGGRKPVLVDLHAKAGYAIGLDLGLMDIANAQMIAVATDLRGRTVHRAVKSRPTGSMDQVLDSAGEMIHDVLRSSHVEAKKVKGIAIGVPGIIDERAGTVRHPTQGGVRTNYRIAQSRWESEWNVPVFIGNDATLAGYGEYRLGLDRPVDNMVYIYSDVGASLILHGHVYWGSSGSAGELGVYLPSSEDYLVWMKSPPFIRPTDWNVALTSQARTLMEEGHATTIRDLAGGRLETITLDMILQAAQDVDALARDLVTNAAMQMGIRIATIVNLLNPEIVMIGGGLEKAGALLLEPVWRAVKRYSYEESSSLVDVLPAKLGENSVALGAACWVIREVFSQV